jgi:hypothetical protein
MQLADSRKQIGDKVLKDIADERGCIRRVSPLLYELAPDEEMFYKKGADEVEGRLRSWARHNSSYGAGTTDAYFV